MMDSIRTDPATGVRDEIGFFGADGSRMFGCLHRPPGVPVAGIVICQGLQSEALANYRREVLLARGLAGRGFAVQRFHYRGTGHSDGESTDPTFESMLADTAAAVRHLERSGDVPALGFVGTRWGGLIAAEVAAAFPGAPLALWEPVVDGGRYFRELFRLRRMHELKAGHAADGAWASPDEELGRQGWVDVLGFSIGRPLYDSAAGLTLEKALGPLPRAVLLVQMDRGRRLRLEYEELSARLVRLGCDVETRLLMEQEPWWFPGVRWQEQDHVQRGNALVGLTAGWITSRFAERALDDDVASSHDV